MNFAINYWFGYFLPVEERFKLIKDAGFDSVLITFEDELEPFKCSRFDIIKKALRLDLSIENAHLPIYSGYNKIWLRPFNQNLEFFNSITKIIKESSSVGIKTIVMHTNDYLDKDINTEYGLSFFKFLTDKAVKCNIKIALENCFKSDLTTLVLNTIDSNNLGLCYDSGHDFLYSKKNCFYKNYLNRLFAVHLNDNRSDRDSHLIPGEGLIDFKKILNDLKRIDFKTAGIEVIAEKQFRENYPPEYFLKKLHNNLKILNLN